MQRPHLVVIGGTDNQPLECVFCGADGARATAAYVAASSDGANELVRLFSFPDHARLATPSFHKLPVIERPASVAPPTPEDLRAAVARIEELGALLREERERTADCERSHNATRERLAKLEKSSAKAKPSK